MLTNSPPGNGAAPHHRSRHRVTTAGSAVAAVLVLAACSTPAMPGATTPGDSAKSNSATSAAASGVRLSVATDAGIVVLDAASLMEIGTVPAKGSLRLNPSGSGDHVFVTTPNGFEVLATGASTGRAPALTGAVFKASAAGHVVNHEGRTALFDDATGTFWVFESDALSDRAELPADVQTFTSTAPHHGVAVQLSDGTVLASLGTEDERVGVRQLDGGGTEKARSEKCPSVHGEGVAADEHVLFGCQDGVLLWADGTFTKLDSPDDFGRVGNTYVAEDSPIAIVDYRDDPDAEGVNLHRMGIVDTQRKSWRVVDLPQGVEYTWQGVDPGEKATAWLVGTDGALHRLDGTTGKFGAPFPLIDAWKPPAAWQDAHPYLLVRGRTAYVTEPAKKSVHAVDLNTGKVIATAQLAGTPNELALAG